MLLSGTTTVADHHYLFSDSFRFDPGAGDLRGRAQPRHPCWCSAAAAPPRGVTSIPTSSCRCRSKRSTTCSIGRSLRPALSRHLAGQPFPGRAGADHADLVDRSGRTEGSDRGGAADEICGCTAICRKAPTMSIFACRCTASGRSNGWPTTIGSDADVWFAHLVHLDPDEVRILASTGTGMAHCPQSNCRLGSGVAPAGCDGAPRRRGVAWRRRRGIQRGRRHDQRNAQLPGTPIARSKAPTR